MTDTQDTQREQELLDIAVAEGGAYEILQKRLNEQGRQLLNRTNELNQQRLDEFGSSQLDIIARTRIRTENNCQARDIVRVGEWLLFGYNVFIGLKRETNINDVFSLYRLVEREGEFEADPVDLENSFLNIPSFVQDFNELYTYYKNTRLLQLLERDGKILASFQIGERISDIRVFRWSISSDRKEIRYIDNRGERDIALPPPYDFEWQKTTRENAVSGRHPHMNILDTVFVETVNGDLTVKIENNTEDGLGIYQEDVLDKNQSLIDAQIEYAKVGSLILLKIQPYREEAWRYLVFNTLTQKVIRIDAIGEACVQLPEDHGIIFPGGYYLQSGEYKTFEQSMQGMRFRRIRRSPNGEDVLYIFYQPEEGELALFNYNMIRRQLQNPIYSHGYAMMEDGRMVIFSGDDTEPTRIHPIQVWQTPYYTEEFAALQPTKNTFMGRIGNAELVRGISELYQVARVTESLEVSSQIYEKLSTDTRKLFDNYYWLDDKQQIGVSELLREIISTSEHVLDEYEKVESIRKQSAREMAEAETRQKQLLNTLIGEEWESVQAYIDALNDLNAQQGLLITLRDRRYIDLDRINAMSEAIKARHVEIAQNCAHFLASEQAMQPYILRLNEVDAQIQGTANAAQLTVPLAELEQTAGNLDMLSALMASLTFEDATEQVRIVDAISEIYARLNQTRVRAQQRHKEQASVETIAQFGAQFKLFGQSITAALAQSSDPERCDEQLSRLLVQLEELESRFSENETFINDIFSKREEMLETFESHKQMLLEERQRKTQSLKVAAERILDSLPRRVTRLNTPEELNTFFASDPMAQKIRDIAERLRDLKDSVKADDIEARFKAAKDQALRVLRDKSEIFEADGNVIKLGPRHRFSVNTQELDLTLLPHSDGLYLHLTGTDFQERVQNETLDSLQAYWQSSLESESDTVYRAEYLAATLIRTASRHEEGLTLEQIEERLGQREELVRYVRDFASPRYKEGYQKGIHDYDAALILQRLLPVGKSAGLLRFNPRARALALLFWQFKQNDPLVSRWPERARTSLNIQQLFKSDAGILALQQEIQSELTHFYAQHTIATEHFHFIQGAEYLSLLLSEANIETVFSKYARQLQENLQQRLEDAHMWADYRHSIENMEGRISECWILAENWLTGLCSQEEFSALQEYIPEAVLLELLPSTALSNRRFSQIDLSFTVSELMGEHPRIQNRQLTLTVDEFFGRVRKHRKVFIPEFQRYQGARQTLLQQEREHLRLSEFKARPLSSFVRNRLINDVYLPIIGDNLAKQMGTVGENKRTDLMGLLLLISPPGYGKTTLMEYIANRLGLIFMKINGPALGHGVHSLDPTQADNATARQELEKLNLALEMGNNVMLYVDDIQHTHPEFLQKFISLCDGTRRIEGVWNGQSRTYDLKGKKFCVVMAGNPYTESGEVFTIPDMLANRADVYNLGEVLGGLEETFALSYIENCLTSNPLLAPLALRDMNDLYQLVDRAMGRSFTANQLSYGYSETELRDITTLLQHLITVRDTLLKVNQQYIISAAQADEYRTEPPFKLQGSYRNMSKLVEKISPVMNKDEIRQLIDDHYLSEAQLLTSGAEENLLKLAEMRGTLDEQQRERWAQIKQEFTHNRAASRGSHDIGNQIVHQLAGLVESVQALRPE